MNFVYIPFHDFKVGYKEGFRTRDCHVILHNISANPDSIHVVVNRPTLYLEELLGRKSRRTKGEVVYSKDNVIVQQVDDNLFVVDVIDYSVAKPIFLRKKFIEALYERNALKISQALDYINVGEFCSYESSPLTVSTVSKLKPKRRVFDGVDNLCLHETYKEHVEHLKAVYLSVLESYDRVIFNSTASYEYFDCGRLYPRVAVLANGVDPDRFIAEYERPEIFSHDVTNVVYAGKMQSMFDVSLVEELAKTYPRVQFYFLGKVLSGGVDKLGHNFENVHFVGDIHYNDLASYITNSDICFIPYIQSAQHGGDPIKFYEYYAAGKKVISTDIGEIKKYANNTTVFVVDRDDFVLSFNSLLKDTLIENRDIPENITWKYIAEQIFGM
ncbi:glycosyltransferase [Shewanella algae]|uniref:glycosyltransferase n=1 Tax=Shewanella algae TaxID=38313 RepID=UPI0016564EB4|nr:glycosyltransferase [Shewanella algae]MBC8796425.1 glycosyltransferase [Shewanella algae]